MPRFECFGSWGKGHSANKIFDLVSGTCVFVWIIFCKLSTLSVLQAPAIEDMQPENNDDDDDDDDEEDDDHDDEDDEKGVDFLKRSSSWR